MKRDTRRRILEVSTRLVAQGGIAALTFDAVAQKLGITKQAVIYWFPTKAALEREIVVPLLRAEADAAVAGLDGASGAANAIERFARALVAFYTEDLTRFRLLYVAVQANPRPGMLWPPEALAEHVHPETTRMYAALERSIGDDPATRPDLHPRRAAATIHMAVLGLVLVVSLGDAIDDSLAHATGDLVDTLVALLCRGAVGDGD